MYLDPHIYSPGLYIDVPGPLHIQSRAVHTDIPGQSHIQPRAVHRCTWTLTHTAQGCTQMYLDPHTYSPGLYIDVPGPSHTLPRAVLYTFQVCSKGTRAIK
jgi:hypothetical protein